MGWLHNVPSAGHVPIAPGTSPTSWYTTPENVQHIAYVGTDGQIHECFFFIGGDNVWHHNIPSAGQVPVAPGTSPTSWYTTPENVQHIAYVGIDGQIHECFFRHRRRQRLAAQPCRAPARCRLRRARARRAGTPRRRTCSISRMLAPTGRSTSASSSSAATMAGITTCPAPGRVAAAPSTSPTSWYTTPENVQHIAYVGTDSRYTSASTSSAADNIWHHSRAERRPGAGGAGHAARRAGTRRRRTCSTSPMSAPISSIHECFYFIGGDNVWHHSVPGAGQMPVAPGTSPTSWYTTPENVQHIAYVGADQADPRVLLLHRRRQCLAPQRAERRTGSRRAGHQPDKLVHDAGERAAHRLCRRRPADPRVLLLHPLTGSARLRLQCRSRTSSLVLLRCLVARLGLGVHRIEAGQRRRRGRPRP